MNPNRLRLAAIALATLLIGAQPAHAGARCDTGRVIKRGDLSSAVLFKCGPPDQRRQVQHRKRGRHYIPVQHWTYILDDAGTRKHLTFHDGRLEHIEIVRAD